MRVLHVYKTSFPESVGGVESFIDTLCKANSQLGVNNKVFTLNSKPKIKPIRMKGYSVYQSKQNLFLASTGLSVSAFGKFKELIECSDIVHYHFPNPFADLLHLLCHVKKPSLITYHSDIVKQKWLLPAYRPLQNYFLDAVDRIVATSPNYYNTSEVLQFYSEKTSIVPIGIDPETIERVNPKRLEFWHNELPKTFFLFVGALRYYKGLDLCLDAIAGEDINLVIVGAKGIEKKLKTKAAKLKLNNVRFLGQVTDEDRAALLHLCHAFVFPSNLRTEAFGISLLEASIAGKAMISCEIGTGTSYINLHNETGIVIKPGSTIALNNAMIYLRDHPKIAYEMGINAKKRVKSLFSADKLAKAYYDLYHDLITN